MRLDKEVGTLNREIVAIKDKWKIALNIDSKKIAIEKLITMRKKLRDNREVAEIIERATKEEIIKMSNNKVVSQVDINSNNKSDNQIKANIPNVIQSSSIKSSTTSNQKVQQKSFKDNCELLNEDFVPPVKPLTKQNVNSNLNSVAVTVPVLSTPQSQEKDSQNIKANNIIEQKNETKPAHLTVAWLKDKMKRK
jgi:hypothetical protein